MIIHHEFWSAAQANGESPPALPLRRRTRSPHIIIAAGGEAGETTFAGSIENFFFGKNWNSRMPRIDLTLKKFAGSWTGVIRTLHRQVGISIVTVKSVETLLAVHWLLFLAFFHCELATNTLLVTPAIKQHLMRTQKRAISTLLKKSPLQS